MRVVCEFETNNDGLVEKALHAHYNHSRLTGEWFNDNIIVSDFLETCQKIDESIKKLKQFENPFI